MNDMINAIKNRISVRDYQKNDLESSQQEEINKILGQDIETPFKSKPRFSLVNIKAFADKEKVKLGTYGFIKGAQYFIVGVSENTPNATIDYGFALEKIILNLTDAGYGTCWLGGAFKRGQYAKAIAISDEEIIPAISPVGLAKSNSLRGKMIRSVAGSKKRKAFNQLFHYETEQANDVFKEALEMVRLGPSADNFQPWRVQAESNGAFHFYLKRNPILKKTIKAADLQLIDMGIAMSHFQFSSEELGKGGIWTRLDKIPAPLQEGLQYIVSWQENA